jgi:hypothetical protein
LSGTLLRFDERAESASSRIPGPKGFYSLQVLPYCLEAIASASVDHVSDSSHQFIESPPGFSVYL